MKYGPILLILIVGTICPRFVTADTISARECRGPTIKYVSDLKKEFFSLQVWSRENGTWDAVVEESDGGNVFKIKDNFPDDIPLLTKERIYKVVSCTTSNECTNSKAIWLPSFSCDFSDVALEKLPSNVVVEDNMGNVSNYHVSPKESMSGLSRVVQYNLYAVRREMSKVLNDWPPLQKPEPLRNRADDIQMLRFNVYAQYELLRQGWVDLQGSNVEQYFDVPQSPQAAKLLLSPNP